MFFTLQAKPGIFSFQTAWAPSQFSIGFINIYIEDEKRVDPSRSVYRVSHQKTDSRATWSIVTTNFSGD